jgi:hypothetical protein
LGVAETQFEVKEIVIKLRTLQQQKIMLMNRIHKSSLHQIRRTYLPLSVVRKQRIIYSYSTWRSDTNSTITNNEYYSLPHNNSTNYQHSQQQQMDEQVSQTLRKLKRKPYSYYILLCITCLCVGAIASVYCKCILW